ncbi:hypothetical protein GCM10009430_32430 [Aquimarina litoralis]|uniref:endo-1,4-beta-xylanase n=1 Tax=Aquimarina litoralis TaxID=584605 RepID=A0ABP3UBR6_9FLAO
MLKFIVLITLTFLSLKSHSQILENEEKFIGNILRGYANNGMEDDSYFKNFWNQATPENAGKHGLVEIERDKYDWTTLDEIYNYCISNNIPFKQHAFLFWSESTTPLWLLDLPKEEIKAELEEWIQDFFNRYPKTEMAEVVNEPIDNPPPAIIMEALGGTENYTWIKTMFSIARKYAPKECRLIINENRILKGDERIIEYNKVVDLLKQSNLIDGIGVQAHFLETVPPSIVKKSLDYLEHNDLPIYITEFDLNQKNDILQKKVLASHFRIFWEHPAIKGITFWGYKKKHIWQTDSFLMYTNGKKRNSFNWLIAYLRGRNVSLFSNYLIEVRAKCYGENIIMGISKDEKIIKKVKLNESGNGKNFQNYYALVNDESSSNNLGIKVTFENDYGSGRYLRINWLRTLGNKIEAESRELNTGAWDNGCGNGKFSEYLHCAGYIDFSQNDNRKKSNLARENTFNSYYDPTIKILHVDFNYMIKNRIVQIMNIHGVLVFSEKTNNYKNSIDVSKFSKGFYIIRIEENAHIQTKKVYLK